jgi:hypothetical protein
MKNLTQEFSLEDVPVNWCNTDAVTSSVMEAVSFVTPVLENYFIRTVVDGIRTPQSPELTERCNAFIREESTHSRMHKHFNSLLINRLSSSPPSLGLIEAMLDRVTKKLPLIKRIELAAVLEHFATVISKLYVNQEKELHFSSPFPQQLFLLHAEEEIGHRSVVFDLLQAHGSRSRLNRLFTLGGALFTVAAYVGLTVPWILYQKSDRKLGTTLNKLGRFVLSNLLKTVKHSPVSEVFSFVNRDFHPDQLFSLNQKISHG